MKLVCAQTHLNSHLSLVSRAVSSRPTHPVLANVLLKADQSTQRVILSAFDLSLGIQTSFPAQVEESGVLTLPAKLLSDIISRLPDGDVTIESDAEGSHVTTLTSASGRYQVRGMGAEEFPELPKIEEGEQTHLVADALVDGLRGSLFAASADETKQVLTGVHVSLQPDGLEFAATDGHRLAVVKTIEEDAKSESEPQLDVTVPAKALQELMKMLDRQNGNAVDVRFDQGQVVFEWADQRLTSRLLEGQYPNYRQLVPRQFTHQLTIDRRLFLSSLERISVLADQKNNIVKVHLDPAAQQLTLSVDAQDVGSGREAIPAQISGEGMEIAFNVRYLLDGLKAINTAEVQMQLNTSTSPVILSPLGSLKMTYLVMPVQVRS
ncbi:DNA polymerase III beta subunit [Leptolyngbya boryana NIES-2135]|jgi:DNA polymerase-3 subunit beta|uniref:Beta sliding clamp n=1 Tax=Leptolyngbya boryana NIES-2135 TaxID=1973484 RepID=A0A1Z4JM23_LEPBY|nr:MULTISPECIES: DNA polymerase III subunit beta [Leptolyngbya]BAY57814.1 DNA polymerase III beta subunit [Leptolyngbya boryana NIES-2135]MBD1856668.1 DNA polymerase III subunit beta [Leptolyngbya sp. FACHB-1624]MBD2367259.1 DNA polymerase III subunit beta [Leptolyngbya sp. FACHB-161]MBD2373784.1 DNA polymerase III subunit beta [Leptolyngbya sp. FACHB-238]MBD2398417.1 DNA polymerase III subunit beta [Leptolyngbya sp. FACHB-239]